ncbi:hypothetical protein FRB99_002501 [Tulasnella sp. 403]|nr:hypothetical protein FRB99_002501 [Tulasnella sp. 403]
MQSIPHRHANYPNNYFPYPPYHPLAMDRRYPLEQPSSFEANHLQRPFSIARGLVTEPSAATCLEISPFDPTSYSPGPSSANSSTPPSATCSNHEGQNPPNSVLQVSCIQNGLDSAQQPQLRDHEQLTTHSIPPDHPYPGQPPIDSCSVSYSTASLVKSNSAAQNGHGWHAVPDSTPCVTQERPHYRGHQYHSSLDETSRRSAYSISPPVRRTQSTASTMPFPQAIYDEHKYGLPQTHTSYGGTAPNSTTVDVLRPPSPGGLPAPRPRLPPRFDFTSRAEASTGQDAGKPPPIHSSPAGQSLPLYTTKNSGNILGPVSPQVQEGAALQLSGQNSDACGPSVPLVTQSLQSPNSLAESYIASGLDYDPGPSSSTNAVTPLAQPSLHAVEKGVLPTKAGGGSPVRMPPKKAKKVEMACHFCRGRKLKCNGEQPQCSHCAKRRQPCTWDEMIRRRGPGVKNKEAAAKHAASKAGKSEGGVSSPVRKRAVEAGRRPAVLRTAAGEDVQSATHNSEQLQHRPRVDSVTADIEAPTAGGGAMPVSDPHPVGSWSYDAKPVPFHGPNPPSVDFGAVPPKSGDNQNQSGTLDLSAGDFSQQYDQGDLRQMSPKHNRSIRQSLPCPQLSIPGPPSAPSLSTSSCLAGALGNRRENFGRRGFEDYTLDAPPRSSYSTLSAHNSGYGNDGGYHGSSLAANGTDGFWQEGSYYQGSDLATYTIPPRHSAPMDRVGLLGRVAH